jgi:hypothetical protein
LWNESFFSAPQLKRDPLGGRNAMAFPNSFESKTMVRLANQAVDVAPVINYLDQAVNDHDGDVTNRGDGLLEFKVPIGTRLLRDMVVRWAPGRWPFSFVSGGTFTATPVQDYVVVSAHVNVSRYLLARVGLFGVVSGLLNPFHSISSFVFGAIIGLAVGAFSFTIAKWEFESWFSTIDRRLRLGDRPRGRLTSA